MAVNQWVDGACYVGADGVMLVSTTTPDGNQVDASGKKLEKMNSIRSVLLVPGVETGVYYQRTQYRGACVTG